MTKKDEFTREQKFELLKGLGRGLVETLKQPIPAYLLSSLGLYAMGKARVLPCSVIGTLQGVNTYLTIASQIEEANASLFNIGGLAEQAAKGGASVGIGLLWAQQAGKSKGECQLPGDSPGIFETLLEKTERLLDDPAAALRGSTPHILSDWFGVTDRERDLPGGYGFTPP